MIRDILQIMHYIHFVHNESEFAKRPKDSRGHDKCYKIRDLFNLSRRNIKRALNLERNSAIDETLFKFKGRVGFHNFFLTHLVDLV